MRLPVMVGERGLIQRSLSPSRGLARACPAKRYRLGFRASRRSAEQRRERLLDSLEQRGSSAPAASTLPGIPRSLVEDLHWLWQVGKHCQQLMLLLGRSDHGLHDQRALGRKWGVLANLRQGRVEALAPLGGTQTLSTGL